jgi:hypothetical protein
MTSRKACIWVILMVLALPVHSTARAVGVEGRVPEAIRSA